MKTILKIKKLYADHLVDCNDWEVEFLSDMLTRVQDGEEQGLPEDEYFLSQRQLDKVDEIWEKLGL